MSYVALRPSAFVSETHTPESRPNCDVYVRNDAPRATGILNEHGVMIYEVPDKAPIGFQFKG